MLGAELVKCTRIQQMIGALARHMASALIRPTRRIER